MVELINDDVIEAIGGPLVERPALVHLDRDEEMVELFGLLASDEQVTEVGVAEHVSECHQALLKQLLAVRHEE